ncbi:MAG: hypothetical protein H7Z42_02035 [Roseiflexaceae bacterium]|nr:hypothetical protein [Roseiflexaceae bacterium]
MRYRNVVLLSLCAALAGCSAPNQQAAVQAKTATTPQATESATLPAPTVATRPEPTAATSQQLDPANPPACAFTGAATAAGQVPALDQYTFSTPRTVLEGDDVAVSQWLPDNQRLLVTTETPDGQGQSITTLDVQTGATEQYAEELSELNERPIWLAAEQAVAFTQLLPSRKQAVLNIAYGTQKNAANEEVSTEIESLFINSDADGERIIVASASDQPRPQVITANAAQRQVTRLGAPENSTSDSSAPERIELESWEAHRTTWSPDGRQVVVYNKYGATLLDVQTGATCALSLGDSDDGPRWALFVYWNPDGQSIAALTSVGGTGRNLPFTAMTLLDINTGVANTVDLGIQYVYEMGWLSNGQLVALGDVARAGQAVQLNLILVDAQTAAYQIVLPDNTFSAGPFSAGDGGLAVAPNGSSIAARCAPSPAGGTQSTPLPAGLCVIDVQAPR